MNRKTILDFRVEHNVWPTVDRWASETGYTLKRSIENTRLYQKGNGILVAPVMMEMKKAEGDFHIEAWIKVGLFVRLSSLFVLPAEIGIESGGIRAVVPRRMARADVNKLLRSFHHPLIP